jgi:tetratricopeptide (TPR) repeat protein
MAALAVAHDPRFAGWEMGAPPPTYEAHEQFLAGIDRFERGDWAAAIPYFARAAALDTTYAQPLLVIAEAYNNLGRPADADSVIRRLERRREALDPEDRATLDRVRSGLDGDLVGALAAARAVVAAAPGAPVARYLHASMALRAGRPREALAAAAPLASTWGRVRTPWSSGVYWGVVTGAHHTLGAHEAELAAARAARAHHPDVATIRAYELRALAALGRLDAVRRELAELEAMPATPGAASVPALLVVVAQELAAHGHPEDARAALRRAIDAARARPAAQRETPATRYELARAHYLDGDYDAAAPLLAALAAERPDDPRYVGHLGLVAARRGQRAEAERAAGRLGALRRPYDRGQTTYARAQLAAALGDGPAALTLLRQALNEGMPYGPALHADPELVPLRSDPGFRALLEPRG